MWPARFVILFYIVINLLIMILLIIHCRLSSEDVRTTRPCPTHKLDDPPEAIFDPADPFHVNDPCNLQHLLSEAFTTKHLRQFQMHCDQVWYNKVAKCGSSFFVDVLDKQVAETTAPCPKDLLDKYAYVSPEEQETLAKALVGARPKPCIRYGHHYFLPFKKFNLPQPLIINLVRHPIPRTVSHYFFKNFMMGPIGELFLQVNDTLKGSLTDCALGRPPFRGCNSFFAHFCEDAEVCEGRGRDAVALVKKNVEQYGMVVGLSEDLPEFLKVLELLSPKFFSGIYNRYVQFKNEKNGSHFSINTNIQNMYQLKSREVMQLPYHLDTEIEFYQFLKQRFYLIKNKLNRLWDVLN